MLDKVGAIGYVSRLFPILPIKVIRVDENGKILNLFLTVQHKLVNRGPVLSFVNETKIKTLYPNQTNANRV